MLHVPSVTGILLIFAEHIIVEQIIFSAKAWRVMARAVKSIGFKLWCLISKVWVRIQVMTLAT